MCSGRNELRRLLEFADGFTRRNPVAQPERARLLILLEELFTNAAKHAYGRDAPPGRIEVALALDSGRIKIEFSDDGRPFDPLNRPLPDLDRPGAGRRVGGLGLHIVRSLADEARYFRSAGRNHLVLGMRIRTSESLDDLAAAIRACTVCAAHLPLGPCPVLRGRPSARLLIISQAPGLRVHQTGLSFDDRSGERLRAWLAVDRETFYDEARVAIMPIGFCYPGRDAKGSDLPPRRECAPLWHARLRACFPAIELTLLVGKYAIDYYLPRRGRPSMTATVAGWRDFLPEFFVLPHPSWHTTRWLRDNPWFAGEALPELRTRVGEVIAPRQLNLIPRSAPYPRR